MRILLVLLVSCLSALAADVQFQWDANKETNIAGYKLYLGPSSRSYTSTQDCRNVTTFTATNLSNSARYYAALTAYNTFGRESDFSTELLVLTPVTAPSGFRYTTNITFTVTITSP